MNGLKIGPQSILNVRSGAYVEIVSKGIIENHATMNIVGNIYCTKSDFSIPYGLRNYGDIIIDEGSIGFGDQSGDVIINETTGYILNKGYISVYVFSENTSVNTGIVNYGTIDNRKGIGLQGMFQGSPLVLKANSIFITKGTDLWDEVYISNQ